MSLRAIVEIVLHLESFRNIDLFQQGLYFLQFEIFHSISGKKFSASPYNFYSDDSASNKLPGEIEDIYYKSKRFYIKYCDEEVEINEVVIFRTEVEINNQAQIPFLSIRCDLMYCDLGGRINERVLKSILESPPSYRSEASLEIKVLDFIEGANQFLPIIFDDSHFCLVNSTVHVILIDFRFRSMPMVCAADEHNSLNKQALDKKIDIPLTLAEIFFPGCSEVSDELIDIVHEKYIRLLSVVHDKNVKLLLS